jgi:hypothetical protein
MVETTMPSGGGGGGDQDRRWTHRWWKAGACRVAPRCHSEREGSWWPNPSQKTRGVKLNGTRIVGGEPTNREKIMGDV